MIGEDLTMPSLSAQQFTPQYIDEQELEREDLLRQRQVKAFSLKKKNFPGNQMSSKFVVFFSSDQKNTSLPSPSETS